MLSVGLSLLLDSGSDASVIMYAWELLVAFVRHYSQLYGLDRVVYNVHFVIHHAGDALQYGSLDRVFSLENFVHIKAIEQLLFDVPEILLVHRFLCS